MSEKKGAGGSAPTPDEEFVVLMRGVVNGQRRAITCADRDRIDAGLEGEALIEFRQRVRKNDIYVEDR